MFKKKATHLEGLSGIFLTYRH